MAEHDYDVMARESEEVAEALEAMEVNDDSGNNSNNNKDGGNEEEYKESGVDMGFDALMDLQVHVVKVKYVSKRVLVI